MVMVALPIARSRLGGEERRRAELLGRRHVARRRSPPSKLTLGAAAIVSLLNAVLGTMTAWVLVRDDFRGKAAVNAIIDLPFALPTIVAGLTLLALYGPASPVGINVAYTRTAIVLAMMFVTLPFVVRTVQPVLQELDPELEQAAHSLGASQATTFRRVVFPNLLPGILSGVALAFAKAVGEFGALVIITGNIPYKSEVSSVYIFGRIESGDSRGRGGRGGRPARHLVRDAPLDRRHPPFRDEARPCVAVYRGSDCAPSSSPTSPSSSWGRSRSSSGGRSRTASGRPGTR